ncbi:MAG: putative glycosyl hydrolase, family 13 [Acidimicrobiia bacterium]|nr:putative glycosyl hydrolase, family 13 [Acidimicrobiia bacterium]
MIYQIYPRSFDDASGDGVGDLAGIRRRVPYLSWLGVDALWLSPIFRSPMADGGYDVSDYCAIDATFGTMAEFDRLLRDSHDAGLRLMLDWVPNHTSSEHPWFVESRSSRTNDKRDWYFWRDGVDDANDGRPNNWLAAFGGRAWTWDKATSQWYLHLFLPQQPDLNWANPKVEAAMLEVLQFWLDRGVDGFRADVIHLIGKDPRLLDQPAALADHDLVGVHDDPSTHGHLRRIRQVLDRYQGERAMVGEVQLGSPALLAPYFGRNDELQLVFNFGLLRSPWDASAWAAVISEAEHWLQETYQWPAWALGNHDTSRQRSRYGGSEERARVAALVLLTLRGTPFLFAGEELGLLDAVVADHQRVDPAGRDPVRAPIPWDDSARHGWDGDPWLPWPPEARQRNVSAAQSNATSIVHLYRRLLALRRASPALRRGRCRLIESNPAVLAYDRVTADASDFRRVLANFSDDTVALGSDNADWVVQISTNGQGEGDGWRGRLLPLQAVVLGASPGSTGRNR